MLLKLMAVSDLKSVPEDYRGEVNMEDFGKSVSNELIGYVYKMTV